MNPDLYAVLPPDKKEEYVNMFPKPVYIKKHEIDSSGLYWVWTEPLKIPEEWLSVCKRIEEINSINRIRNIQDHMGCYISPDLSGVYISKVIEPMGVSMCISSLYTPVPLTGSDYINKISKPEIGLSHGEQRLIKKGVV